jgi:hypothetical protein
MYQPPKPNWHKQQSRPQPRHTTDLFSLETSKEVTKVTWYDEQVLSSRIPITKTDSLYDQQK